MTDLSDETPDLDQQDSDYDGAWKEALRQHLRAFLEKCFPLLAELIDWNCEPEWLDKEIGQIIGQAGHRNRVRPHRAQTRFDVAQALAKRELRECETQKLIATREAPQPIAAPVPTNARVEFVTRKQLHELRKNQLPRQHLSTLAVRPTPKTVDI